MNLLFFGGDGSFLSNFYSGPGSFFSMINQTFPTSEHAYQYIKAMKAGDRLTALMIRKAETPLAAKTLSHQISFPLGFEEEWNTIRKEVMRDILWKKFENPKLRKMLIETEGKILVEATGDTFWGCGFKKDDPRINDPSEWTGCNWLGILLMELRAELSK